MAISASVAARSASATRLANAVSRLREGPRRESSCVWVTARTYLLLLYLRQKPQCDRDGGIRLDLPAVNEVEGGRPGSAFLLPCFEAQVDDGNVFRACALPEQGRAPGDIYEMEKMIVAPENEICSP